MKIGISTMAKNVKEKIRICKELSFNHLEIGIDNFEDWNYVKDSYCDLKRSNISIGIHLPMEMNVCEPIKHINDSWLNYLRENHNEGKKIGVEYYNLHLGYGIKNKVLRNRENYLDNALYFFYNLFNNIDDIKISIENTYSEIGDFINLGTNVDDFKIIFDNIETDKLFFCYDSGHNLINKSEYIEKINHKIKLTHLSQNDGIKDLHLGLSQNGKLKIDEIKNILKLKHLEYVVLEMDNIYLKDSKKILLQN